MKNSLKRISAGLLALFIVVSLLPMSISAAHTIVTTPTGYTSAADVNYVKDGKYVANWGARGEVCVFLSSYAQDFYTGSNTFEALSALTGGSSQNNAPQSALYAALKSFMTTKHSYQTSYDATKELYRYTDCVLGDYSKLSSFYSGKMVASAWSSGGKTWNREHTWPNSKGLGGNDENDIMMLRPTIPTENGSRGNKAYGIGSGCFDPGVDVHGDVARIFLYVYTRWGNTSGNGQYTAWGSSGVIQSLDVLLDWMEEDPVDTWEMGRNDAVQSITGVRNVFVDYPEFAWLLCGQDVPSGITTPSDNDGITANPGGNTPPPVTEPPVTQPPVTQPPVTQPPVTQPPVTQPPVTQPPVSQPSVDASTPVASQPIASEGTQASTPATKPAQPAPMATAPVNPDDFIPAEEPTSVGTIVAIVLGVLAVGAIIYFVVIYFVVIKPKKSAPVADATPAEDIPEETPADEPSEEAPTEENE